MPKIILTETKQIIPDKNLFGDSNIGTQAFNNVIIQLSRMPSIVSSKGRSKSKSKSKSVHRASHSSKSTSSKFSNSAKTSLEVQHVISDQDEAKHLQITGIEDGESEDEMCDNVNQSANMNIPGRQNTDDMDIYQAANYQYNPTVGNSNSNNDVKQHKIVL